MREITLSGHRFILKHILADGREVDDLSEVTLPAGHPAYKFLAELPTVPSKEKANV